MTPQDQYYAGFMSKRPNWGKALRAYRKDLGVLVTDLLVLVALWGLASFIWNDFAHGTRDFLSVPWWIVLVVCFELALVWEAFALSPGMRLLGRRAIDARDGRAVIERRTLRALLLHGLPLLVLPILATARYVPWQDQLAGFQSVSAAEVPDPRKPWYRTSWMVAIAILAVAMYLASALFTQVDLVKLFTNAGATTEIWDRIFHPDWSIFGLGVRLLIVTLFMAFMATLFGVLVAVPLSFLAARNLARGVIGRPIYMFLRILMSVVRSIEPIIWAIIFVVWVRTGAAAFAGALALFVHSIADLTKLYSERLESIDPGPVEAIRATGANGLQVILYGVVPQIINPYLSFTIYRWDINVRMATIIGLVGGGGIGQRLIQLTRNWVWDQAIVLMLLIMVAVWAMDYSSSRLRERLN
jgi:phosphonate transport system permease protein